MSDIQLVVASGLELKGTRIRRESVLLVPSRPETVVPLGVGSGAREVGCYAIIGIQPSVPISYSVCVWGGG